MTIIDDADDIKVLLVHSLQLIELKPTSVTKSRPHSPFLAPSELCEDVCRSMFDKAYLQFYCRRCAHDSCGNFDFLLSLTRVASPTPDV